MIVVTVFLVATMAMSITFISFGQQQVYLYCISPCSICSVNHVLGYKKFPISWAIRMSEVDHVSERPFTAITAGGHFMGFRWGVKWWGHLMITLVWLLVNKQTLHCVVDLWMSQSSLSSEWFGKSWLNQLLSELRIVLGSTWMYFVEKCIFLCFQMRQLHFSDYRSMKSHKT